MMSTNQKELFNKVKTHLLMQKAKSKNWAGCCMYRDGEEKRCALGCLISDEVYDEGLEGEGLCERTSGVKAALEKSGVHFDEGVFDMLCALQCLHDDSEPDTWATKLDDLEENLNR